VIAGFRVPVRASLVGTERFELSTYGLRVGLNIYLSLLIGMDTIYINQHVMRIRRHDAVDLHMGIYGEFAYRLPTDCLQIAYRFQGVP
jgi:hypothetical protein